LQNRNLISSCSHALSESARKAEKSKNKNGDPIQLPSKILDVAPDPLNEARVYVAEAAGTVKKIDLEVG
jgi:protocatechuate 3,4-dioxygenase beta subunit